MLCRSRLVSSEFVFPLFSDALGGGADELLRGAIADFGVSGLIAVLRGSGPGLVGEDPTLEFCAVATPIRTAKVAQKIPILHFVI